jgi:transposase
MYSRDFSQSSAQLFLGVDYHKQFSLMTLMDKEGRVVKRGKLANQDKVLSAFLSPFNEYTIHSTLEAGRNWMSMYDSLERLGTKVFLAHPSKVKVIAEAKVKTDKIDSQVLADLLRTNFLPTAYVASETGRDQRSVLRQRMFLVRLRTMIKNRITTLVDKYPELRDTRAQDTFSQKGEAWLKTIKVSTTDRILLNQDLEALAELGNLIDQSNQLIKDLAKDNEDIQHLTTMPGIGTFFATLIVTEVDNINRFLSDKKFHAYIGIVPSTHASGGKSFNGRLTKQGNKYLRWAFTEAVWPAIRSDSEIKAYYQQIKLRKGPNPAKIATARRLATIAYHLLKDKRIYRRLPSTHLRAAN